jgi:hypothetical protein
LLKSEEIDDDCGSSEWVRCGKPWTPLALVEDLVDDRSCWLAVLAVCHLVEHLFLLAAPLPSMTSGSPASVCRTQPEAHQGFFAMSNSVS